MTSISTAGNISSLLLVDPADFDVAAENVVMYFYSALSGMNDDFLNGTYTPTSASSTTFEWESNNSGAEIEMTGTDFGESSGTVTGIGYSDAEGSWELTGVAKWSVARGIYTQRITSIEVSTGGDAIQIYGNMVSTQNGVSGTVTQIEIQHGNLALEYRGSISAATFIGTLTELSISDNLGNSITLSGSFSTEIIPDTAVSVEAFLGLASVLNSNDVIHADDHGGRDWHGYGGNDRLIGGASSDILYGDTGADTLDGGAGADELHGGIGNDTYFIDDAGDDVIENLNEGMDLVQSTVDYVLADHVENLLLSGSSNIDGTGNALVNSITGNGGDNILDGAGGVDRLAGGAGDDTYVVDLLKTSRGVAALQDTVVEAANAGTDTLTIRAASNLGLTSIQTLTLAAGLENLDASHVDSSNRINLTGNAAANTITGNDANNILNGAAGNDSLIGRLGDDTYIVDSSGDTVTENVAEGLDTVNIAYNNRLASVAFINVDTYANVEIFRVTGRGLFDLSSVSGQDVAFYGNASANTLTSGAGEDYLNGGAGADHLVGGDGDDGYQVDSAGDVIVEQSNEGDDYVWSTVSYTLGDNIESLELQGRAAINATGNALSNALFGNIAANILDGGANADSMAGDKGNDTYIVDNASDTVIEAASEGVDSVRSSVDYTLVSNVENLILTGSANINGTGNELVNIVTGNAGNNILDGAGGIDRLIGGIGNDTYIVDLLKTTRGAAVLQDAVVETVSAGGGVDTLSLRAVADLGFSTTPVFALAKGLENLDAHLVHSNIHIALTGNAVANIITGNDGNNIFNGGAGIDSFIGKGGDDQYYLDSLSETITEASSEGNDRIYIAFNNSGSAQTLDLANFANVENVQINGRGLFDVIGSVDANYIIGNASANQLSGEAGDDTLSGGAGNDVLNGGLGADTLIGGVGADIFVFDQTDTGDTVTDFSLSEGDALDISNLLSGYDSLSDDINNFVRIIASGGDSYIEVDTAGGGNSWSQIAVVSNVDTLGSVETLVANHDLIV